jgi:vanillate O-demethylase ferredoxin subunit
MTARLIMRLAVAAARPVTDEVLLVDFRHPRRPTLPPWSPGAHVDLRLPDGRVRQYSLCGDPDDLSFYRVAIKREADGRGGSLWAHANLEPGAAALVSAPRNNFPLAANATRHVLVAGGIGVTPMLPMVRALAARGADFQMHHCARSRPLAPLIDALEHICGPRLHRWFAADGQRFDPAMIGAPDTDAHLYACGPRRLLDAVQEHALAAGWAEARIHVERFQATLDENFKPEPFDARLASSGQVLHVPADQSLLQVLRAHGVAMPSSCELGVCGSCICGYRDGVVIHRDQVLAVEARQDRMTPCVSRARVGVTLDL